MTIKQQGGIFGRNPTLNNVTVDGTLTVDQIVEKTGAAGITLDGVTLKDGNVVLADGKGIDFSATSGTGTSELFDDYEEGTWTPVVADASSGGNESGSSFSGYYTKIGNLIFVNCSLGNIDTTGLTSGNDVYIRGLPYASKSGTYSSGSVFGRFSTGGKWCVPSISSEASVIRIEDSEGDGTNPDMVTVGDIPDDAGDIRISITYIGA
jgi:hypothetical protein